VRGVVLEDGERIAAKAVVAAVDVQAASCSCWSRRWEAMRAESWPPRTGERRAARVHVATDRLPPYRGAREGDWNGLQSHVDTTAELTRGFLAAEARRLPDPPPTYCFTPSAYDDSLAPAGMHTVYLACPCAPFEVDGGWQEQADAFAQRMVDQVEEHAPGFRDSISAMHVRTPTAMAEELRWPGAHPMHLDISLDQLAFMRPTRRLAGHTVPGVPGLFTCDASTAPVGGIAGSSGKAAALRLLSSS
jgi:phytoene dehydrogenase-like protein